MAPSASTPREAIGGCSADWSTSVGLERAYSSSSSPELARSTSAPSPMSGREAWRIGSVWCCSPGVAVTYRFEASLWLRPGPV